MGLKHIYAYYNYSHNTWKKYYFEKHMLIRTYFLFYITIIKCGNSLLWNRVLSLRDDRLL